MSTRDPGNLRLPEVVKMDKKYSVGIISLGHVGRELCKKLPYIPEIKQLYVFSNDPGKLAFSKKDCTNNSLNFIPMGYGDISDEKGNIDIMVLTSDGSNYRETGLSRDNIDQNIDIIKRMGMQLKDYPNNLIVVTNPVDIVSYLMASWSGIPPEHITGLNHIDQRRWNNLITERFMAHSIKKEFDPNLINTVVIGPHSGEAVPIFTDYAGMPKEQLKFLYSDAFSAIRRELAEYAFTQLSLGRPFGEGTEGSAADSVGDVIRAIIDQTSCVCQSTFIEPDVLKSLLDLEIGGALEGIYFGMPVTFKDMKAIPQNVVVDAKADQDLIKSAYEHIEQKILRLEQKGYLPTRLGRVHALPEIIEESAFSKSSKRVDLEARVFAANTNSLYEWPDPNSPNQNRQTKLKEKIGTFSLEDIDGKMYILTGHEGRVSLRSLDFGEETYFLTKQNGLVRRISLARVGDKDYMVASTDNQLFLFNLKGQKTPVAELYQPTGNINNMRAYQDYLYVAARKILKYDLSDPENEDKIEIYTIKTPQDKLTDVGVDGRMLYTSFDSAILRFDETFPALTPTQYKAKAVNILSFEIYPYHGNSIFIASATPSIYRFTLNNPMDATTYQKEPQNRNGSGRIKLVDQSGLTYLLASDRSRGKSTPNSGISIWETSVPEKPGVFLPTLSDEPIKGLGVMKND